MKPLPNHSKLQGTAQAQEFNAGSSSDTRHGHLNAGHSPSLADAGSNTLGKRKRACAGSRVKLSETKKAARAERTQRVLELYGQSIPTLEDQATIESLVTEGVDVSTTDCWGCTPLHGAVSTRHTQAVRLLLGIPGIDVNKADDDGCTPLHKAARQGYAEVVILLLSAPGIDVNKADKYGYTPLYKAAGAGHEEVVILLLGTPGIDVNKVTNSGRTPLYFAGWSGKVKVVRLLLAVKGIDVNRDPQADQTLLHMALSQMRPLVVRLLLGTPGIDVSKTDHQGKTAVSVAASRSDMEAVGLLLEYKDAEGYPADLGVMDWLAWLQEYPAMNCANIVQVLIHTHRLTPEQLQAIAIEALNEQQYDLWLLCQQTLSIPNPLAVLKAHVEQQTAALWALE